MLIEDTVMSRGEHLDRVDAADSGPSVRRWTFAEFAVTSISVDGGSGFDRHRHEEDQLAWMASGSMELSVGSDAGTSDATMRRGFRPGVLHEMRFPEAGETRQRLRRSAAPTGPDGRESGARAHTRSAGRGAPAVSRRRGAAREATTGVLWPTQRSGRRSARLARGRRPAAGSARPCDRRRASGGTRRRSRPRRVGGSGGSERQDHRPRLRRRHRAHLPRVESAGAPARRGRVARSGRARARGRARGRVRLGEQLHLGVRSRFGVTPAAYAAHQRRA